MTSVSTETPLRIQGKGSPVVSVIIPTYNRANMVGRAIQSVLAQTFQDFEMLVVDDYSTDNTEDVVTAFQDPRIRYLRHDRNKGGAAARNTGIRAARGEYIAFLDSDDEWLPKKLEIQLEVFKKSELQPLGVVLAGYVQRSKGREKAARPHLRGWLYEETLELKGMTTTPGIIVKRAYLGPDFLFDEDLPALQERDFLIKLAGQCQFDCCPRPLYTKNAHDGDRITNPSNQLAARRALLRKYHRELSTRPTARARHHFLAAVNCHQLNDMPGLRHHLIQAIRANPENCKWVLLLLSSLFGSRLFLLTCAIYNVAKRVHRKKQVSALRGL